MMESASEVVSFLHQLLDFAVTSPNTKVINWFPSWIFHEIFLPNTSSFNSFSCSQQVKIIESRNKPGKKIWTHEIPTKKSFGPTKYILKTFAPTKYSRGKFQTHEIPVRKNLGHKIPTRKKFGPTKYPREKILDPQIPTKAHGTRPTMVHKPQT